MSALLVERDPAAYKKLAQIPPRFPDVSIHVYPADFLTVLPTILKDIPANAFAFFLVDPRGWRIRLRALNEMLARPSSEIVFNFMFDFINRAACITDPAIASKLDELIPYGDWRARLDTAERDHPCGLTSDQRKAIFVEAFAESLARLGNYEYVAETTVLRPVKDRPLYCLFYATRHPTGIEVFRDCQVKALTEQSNLRAATKVKYATTGSGQGEFFESLHEMGPPELTAFLQSQRQQAEKSLLGLTPEQPGFVLYSSLWPRVLARHIVTHPEVNQIATRLRKDGRLLFPSWEKGKRVPQPHYRTQRPKQ